MPQKQAISVENNFVAGLKTDYTGLNCPENAATDTFDCIYTLEGDVLRRPGFDPEQFYEMLSVTEAGAVTSYRWLNAGGDGDTQVYVLQIGGVLYFYKSSIATVLSPLSTTILVSTVNLVDFLPTGVLSATLGECQFTDGNGYLFVFNPALDPFYCTYVSGTITGTRIEPKVRDFKGIEDNLEDKERPQTLSTEHEYNLVNQGWTNKTFWSVDFSDNSDTGVGYLPLSWTGNGFTGFGPNTGAHSFNVGAGLPIEVGQVVYFEYDCSVYSYNIDEVDWFTIGEHGVGLGVVTDYSGSTLSVNITNVDPNNYSPNWELVSLVGSFNYHMQLAPNENSIRTFYDDVGVYPSNTDVWFQFKETLSTDTPSGTAVIEKFSPKDTIAYMQQSPNLAPKGHFIVNAFDQQFDDVSGLAVTPITTTVRPRTGAWFAGRVWYAGCDASQDATGDQPYYTWTENIYFSQIIEDSSGSQFDKCYQFDDPTDENFYLLLPTDGGVITIQGCGSIYKLFPVQNGMLVFAANGIWFITGSGGIGFNATDYTVTKISGVRSISGTSYVDVNGLPMFWNEEAIYYVQPAQQGSGLVVEPITNHQIDTFYGEIPYESKLVARGSYDPVDYVVQWLYYQDQTDDPINYVFEGDYTFDFFDISCHSVRSTDNGDTWVEGMTPDAFAGPGGTVNTGFHDWGNCAMPVTDGENNGLMVAVDLSQDSDMGNGATSGAHYGNRFLGISETGGGYGTWDMIEPWTSDVAMTPIDLAVSSSQDIIMTLPQISFFQPAYHAPAISYDLGSTWENLNITPAAASTHWARAAFSKDCEYMYLIGSDTVATHLYVSTDLGQNWTQLTNFGVYADKEITITDINASRLRCSADGRIILYTDLANNLSYSTDWGDTWTIRTAFAENDPGVIAAFDPDPVPVPGDPQWPIVNYCSDAGVSANGNAMIVMWYNGYSYPGMNQLFLSTDEGVTWTNISPDQIFTAWEGDNLIWNTCNISPDGQVILVGIDYDNDTTGMPANTYRSGAYVSFDQGQTWTLKEFTMDSPLAIGSDVGNFTDAYVSQSFVNTTGTHFNRALNYRTTTKAWYPWTISQDVVNDAAAPLVYDIKYVQNPGGVGAPDGIFKYVMSVDTDTGFDFTFAECSDTSYYDWDFGGTTGTNYESYFLTAYKLHGQAIRKWQPEYIQVYSRNDVPTKYHIQGVWQFGNNRNSGRWSNKQRVSIDDDNFSMWTNKLRMRGSGLVLQLRVSSIDNNPFDIMGWSMMENQNPNV